MTKNLKTQALQKQITKLKAQLEHDALTGLYNRHFLIEWIKQHRADMISVIVAYIDLDHLKPINDRYGHVAGDKMLCHVSDLLKQCCRKTDYAIRISGDEFLLLVLDVPPEKVANVSKRLQTKLQQLSIVGFSLGIASGLSIDIREIIALADQQMYLHKKLKFAMVEH